MFQTFERRMDTVERAIRRKKRHRDADLWTWEWLKELLINLGEQGMSSDESDVDNQGRAYFCVKKLPWRAPIEGQLTMIDNRRAQEKSELNRRGAVPLMRLRNRNAVFSERPPPQKLPQGVFDKHWLRECPDRHKLRMSDKNFDIMDIGAQV